MKIALPQLMQQVTKPLSGIYLVSGDETLLVEEAIQVICDAAKNQGYTERQRITADAGEWAKSLYTASHSLSLFSDKRLLLLDLSEIKLNAASSKLLQEYAQQADSDTLLIIQTQKLDYKTEQTAWFKAIEKQHTIVQVWPITLAQLPAWIMQRAKKIGLTIQPRAAEILAQYCEGHLLAASQEIEKLKLFNIEGVIDEHLLAKLATDNAHFDIYVLVESALLGNGNRCLRILKHLQAEGIEPTLVLWAFTNELRLLNTLMKQSPTTPLPMLFKQHRVWEKRQAPIQQFMRRRKQQDCWHLLLQAADVDRVIKGAESGNKWDELQKLALAML